MVRARWATRTGEWADRLNGLPKYVVSATLDEPKWGNSTVLKGDVVSEVAALKERLDGEIVVYASYQLGHTLLEHELVDELRVTVFPVVLGTGERLFCETSDKKAMRLLGSRIVGVGLVLYTYEPSGASSAGQLAGVARLAGRAGLDAAAELGQPRVAPLEGPPALDPPGGARRLPGGGVAAALHELAG